MHIASLEKTASGDCENAQAILKPAVRKSGSKTDTTNASVSVLGDEIASDQVD
jgi:hypothetical protein